MAKNRTSVVDVRKLITAEEEQLAKLRKRREALLAAEEREFAKLKKRREDAAAAEQRGYEKLAQKREALAAQVAALADQIAELGGAAVPVEAPAPVRKRKKRRKAAGRPAKKAPAAPKAKKAPVVRKPAKAKGKGKVTLRAAVAQVIAAAGRPMRASEIAAALGDTGYQSASKNMKNMVSATLAQAKDFRRVRKGLYGIRKTAK